MDEEVDGRQNGSKATAATFFKCHFLVKNDTNHIRLNQIRHVFGLGSLAVTPKSSVIHHYTSHGINSGFIDEDLGKKAYLLPA